MKLPPLRPLIVGIDPGASTGVGIFDRRAERVLSWATKDFYTVQEFLARVFPDKSVVTLIVELPPTFTYARHNVAAGKERDARMKMQAMNRKEAQLLAGTLKRQGWHVIEVPPVPVTKWDMRKFQQFAKTNQTASEHERDAVRLASYYANYRKEIAR